MAGKRKAKRAPARVASTKYTSVDLANALVSARLSRDGVPELRDYHERRLAAFTRAFDFPTRDAASQGNSRHLRRFVDDVVESVARSSAPSVSPFEGMLEAPPEIIALAQRYGSDISTAETQIRLRLKFLLRDVVAQLVPEARAITDEDLMRHGFDPRTPEPGAGESDDSW